MVQNIIVAGICIIVFIAFIWSWWIDNGCTFFGKKESEKECEECKDEKN